jgi:sodium-dependent phosphate transporter
MLVASSIFLLPWIQRNLPTVQGLNSAEILVEEEFENSDEDTHGIVMTEQAASDNSRHSEHKSLQPTPTHSEDGSIGIGDVEKPAPSIGSNDSEPQFPVANTDTDADGTVAGNQPTERDDAMFCFRVLLVFNAALKSFAHGANDTANATGPFTAVLEIHDYGFDICEDDGRKSKIWIMVLAGSFVALGIVTFGHRVITTVGEKLTLIDYHSGFCIEFGSAVTVVVATELGIPVSTTHCQIGAVIGTGLLTAGEGKVHWNMIGKIALTWVVTVPFSGLLAVAFMEMLRPAFV